MSVASGPLSPSPATFPKFFRKFALAQEPFELLTKKNSFYGFESTLHVFPLLGNPRPSTGLEEWNSKRLWRSGYKDPADGLLFFAEDAFQDQFCISAAKDGVFRFHPETGQTLYLADSLEHWSDIILGKYRYETGWPLASEFQKKNGPLQPGRRLMPKTPFFLGGEYKIENLWSGDAIEGMRFKADIAMQIRNLPNGAQMGLVTGPKPN